MPNTPTIVQPPKDELEAKNALIAELADALRSLLIAATQCFDHPEYGAVLKARRVLAKLKS